MPANLKHVVCGCLGGKASCNPLTSWAKGYREEEIAEKYPLKFPWWVCSACLKPAPLNALNARLIRECEVCEEPYLISVWPDFMNLCQGCDN